jgi:hypothetical protein
MLPAELGPALADVAARRCSSCHASGIPRTFYTRMLRPENNDFLLAPLARAAGGTEACARAVFATKDDPDYRLLIETFRPIQELLRRVPRADMEGFVPPPCRVPAVPDPGVGKAARPRTKHG